MVAIPNAPGVRSGLPPTLGYTAGKYYGPSIVGGLFGTAVSMTANFQYYTPFICRKTQAFDRIAVRNTAAVTDHIRLAIYADDGGGHPGARQAESGEITLSGAAADNAATISVTLNKGLYWLAYVGDATISLEGFNSTGLGAYENISDFGLGVTNATAGAGLSATAAFTYAQHPATATAVTTLWTIFPYIRLRAA